MKPPAERRAPAAVDDEDVFARFVAGPASSSLLSLLASSSSSLPAEEEDDDALLLPLLLFGSAAKSMLSAPLKRCLLRVAALTSMHKLRKAVV